MTIKEILQKEDPIGKKITLYNEGLFWKAYEQSAFRFIFGINQYKSTKKHIKAVETDVVSIGFPTSSLDKFSDKFKIIYHEGKQMIIEPNNLDTTEVFEEWKASIQFSESTLKEAVSLKSTNFNLEQEILSFNMESKTPMECMIWIAELKQKIQKQANG